MIVGAYVMISDSSDGDQSTPVTDSSPAASQPPTESRAESQPTGERPSQRIQIGSQRGGAPAEAKAKPFTPAAPPGNPPATAKKEAKHYPPPNIRDQLSPELEREYQEALGELSFDAL